MATCPDGRCDGSGFLYDEAARRARPCSCRPGRIARKRAAALEGRIPQALPRGVARARAADLDRAREPAASSARCASTCARSRSSSTTGRGIWFTGDVGTGKTTLAMLISKAAMEADRTVAIYSLPRLLALLRDTYQDDAQYSLNDLIDRLSAVDLLHVDDVGAEQTSPWVLEQLYTIVNTRYEDGKAIMVTTNLIKPEGDDGLVEQIGRAHGVAPVRDLRRPEADVRRGPAARDPLRAVAAGSGRGAGVRRAAPAAHLVPLVDCTPKWPASSSSAPSGATRARARSPTCSPRTRTSSSASRAATTPATRSSATA